MRKNVLIATQLSAAIVFALIPNPSEAASLNNLKNGEICSIVVEDVHLSEDIKAKTGKVAVKANATAYCNQAVTLGVLTVQLWKKGTYFDHFIKATHAGNKLLVARKVVIRNKNTYEECTDARTSVYFGKAKVEGTVNGKPFSTVWVSTKNPSTICCGTKDRLL